MGTFLYLDQDGVPVLAEEAWASIRVGLPDEVCGGEFPHVDAHQLKEHEFNAARRQLEEWRRLPLATRWTKETNVRRWLEAASWQQRWTLAADAGCTPLETVGQWWRLLGLHKTAADGAVVALFVESLDEAA